MSYYLRNPELKSILIKLVLVQLIFACITYMGIRHELATMNQTITKQNIALTGNLLAKYPQLESEIIPYITKPVSPEEAAKGSQILAQYGYQADISTTSQPLLKDFDLWTPNKIAILVFTFIFPITLLVFLEYKKIYGKVRKISLAAEHVVDGDYHIVLPEGREGEFETLGHNFNLMAGRLKLSLERLSEEKVFLKTIISDISHQLKTPLSSLITMNELLLTGKVNEEHKLDFLEKCKSQLNRMEWLITNLLKMARLEAGAIPFKSERILLSHVVEKALYPLQESIENKRQRVCLAGNGEGAYFSGDEDWTAEALTNILKNCVEHTGVQGEIQIEFADTPLFSRITIYDNGEGIDPKDLPHIFERFYKGSNSVKTESVGIGLALSRVIIESQNGNISVNSEKGKGTQFVVTFLKSVI